MNNRPQGGSVLRDGRIELMQNRRSVKDDDRGMGEAISEVRIDGVGITVAATYHV